MQFPRLPDEDELEKAYAEQRAAAQAGDKRRLSELHQTIEQLQQQLESARRAVDIWQRTDPVELEERIAWELTRAPHADVLVGIPAEANRA
jgi:thymidylate synthase